MITTAEKLESQQPICLDRIEGKSGRSIGSGRSLPLNYPAVVILVISILLIHFCISALHLGGKQRSNIPNIRSCCAKNSEVKQGIGNKG